MKLKEQKPRRVLPRFGLRLATMVGMIVCTWIVVSQVWGADEIASIPTRPDTSSREPIYWALTLFGSVAALFQAFLFYKAMVKSDPGTPRMIEIAGYVREGAAAYLRQQYRIVTVYFIVVAILLAAMTYFGVQEKFVALAFLTGGFYSGLAGFIGMRTATQASNRTAAGARKSLNAGLQVAFRSGAVMGLTVVGLGLWDFCCWYAFLRWVMHYDLNTITVTLLCSAMGASSQALFARVGGGIFTKAADVGADLVGKVEHSIPEDDPRNPATIADNVGDNVGDVAGMGADLYESYYGSILATMALGVSAFSPELLLSAELPNGPADVAHFQLHAAFLPAIIASLGILASIFSIYTIRASEDTSQAALLKVLGRGVSVATFLVIAIAFGATYYFLPDFMGIGGSIVVGLIAGWMIGKWTEYATSDEYQPTKDLASQAETGPATVIIGGIADGMKSIWVPVLVVSASTLLAFGLANGFEFMDIDSFSLGLYGVGIAAVGMLSTLGITLATDAYGPIADNAGGNAQMSELEPFVRERTDALDSLGNTTAATGKGFAIGSAALTALALLAAYVDQIRLSFNQWGNDAAIVMEADSFYKLSEGLVVYNPATKDASATAPRIAYLAMPEDLRDRAVRGTWTSIEVKSGAAVKIPDGIFTVEKNADGVPSKVAFKATGDQLIPTSKITIPEIARFYDASLLNPKVLIGVFLGCMATFVFCAMTMKAVGRAAKGMVEEVRRQFREKPGIMNGTEKPDYALPVQISTVSAQREMILPSMLGLITPLATGLILGVPGVIGLLVGCLTCGFSLAIFMANSGGSWDNAKKYIEAGHLGGKGSDAHKAAVVGDTVGDPFKDTSGPSLNILLKLMSIVSVVAAGLVVRYSLMALGIF